jgi:hypothetical protein
VLEHFGNEWSVITTLSGLLIFSASWGFALVWSTNVSAKLYEAFWTSTPRAALFAGIGAVTTIGCAVFYHNLRLVQLQSWETIPGLQDPAIVLAVNLSLIGSVIGTIVATFYAWRIKKAWTARTPL